MTYDQFLGFSFPDTLIPTAAGVGHQAALDDYKAKLADHAFALAQLSGNPVTLDDFKEVLNGKTVAGYTYDEHKTAFGIVRSCQYLAANNKPIIAEDLVTLHNATGWGNHQVKRSAIGNSEINELSPRYERSGYPDHDYLGGQQIGAGFIEAIRLFLGLINSIATAHNTMNSLLISAGHKAIIVPTARVQEYLDAVKAYKDARARRRLTGHHGDPVDATALVTLLVDLQK